MSGIQNFNFPYGNSCSEIFVIYISIKHNPAVDDFLFIVDLFTCLGVFDCDKL